MPLFTREEEEKVFWNYLHNVLIVFELHLASAEDVME